MSVDLCEGMLESVKDSAEGYIEALDELSSFLINQSVVGDATDAELMMHIRTVNDMRRLVKDISRK
ncbi:MAG: hypothetical protein IJ552_11570 [Prevotella sp.]|nr:hypothetical protein [Prevotella sp.]